MKFLGKLKIVFARKGCSKNFVGNINGDIRKMIGKIFKSDRLEREGYFSLEKI